MTYISLLVSSLFLSSICIKKENYFQNWVRFQTNIGPVVSFVLLVNRKLVLETMVFLCFFLGGGLKKHHLLLPIHSPDQSIKLI